MQLLAVALGGALGAILRYGFVSMAGFLWGTAFPWGTLGVNIIGSLIMGFVVGGLDLTSLSLPFLKLFLTVGLLGGFTTFSAFSMDTMRLFESGQTSAALAYMLASLVLTVLACWAGLIVARGLWA